MVWDTLSFMNNQFIQKFKKNVLCICLFSLQNFHNTHTIIDCHFKCLFKKRIKNARVLLYVWCVILSLRDTPNGSESCKIQDISYRLSAMLLCRVIVFFSSVFGNVGPIEMSETVWRCTRNSNNLACFYCCSC